jgi:predicted ATPase
MINSITFKQDFRCFKKDDTFEFRQGINVLVGDQGSGKSTLIELIRLKFEPKHSIDSNDSSYRAKYIDLHNKIDDLVEIKTSENSKCIAFDFERESARDMSMLHFDMISEQIASMHLSHGQSVLILLKRILDKVLKSKDNIETILFDEPDASLSPRSCYSLLEIFRGLVEKYKKQLIISAHNPILIYGVHPMLKKEFQNIYDEILSLEDKKWMRSKDYMLYQFLPNPLENEESRKI